MSNEFRELLRKIGSGPHTSKDLTRQESAAATRMILLGEATPAQIGAFMIAHRIKRPTAEELAGMLDAYNQLGPTLPALGTEQPVLVLGSPYDGRSRTAPLSPLTALLLATVGCPVVMHGGDRMPTKQGVPLVDLWEGLGVNWRSLSLAQVHQVLQATGVGLVYLPQHFPLAQSLVPYRDEIGKRPPFATIELMWSPYGGEAHVVSGFVHPPTEANLQLAFQLRGNPQVFTTVKGLEGSCDLPRDRTAIIGLGTHTDFERLLLHAREYNLAGPDVPFDSTAQTVADLKQVLQGQGSEMMRSVIWNGGFYLWRAGVCGDIATGLAQAEALFSSGQVAQTLANLTKAVSANLQDHALTG